MSKQKQETAMDIIPIKRISGKSRADIMRRFDDDYDAIYDAYTNPRKRDKLTITQTKQLARWKFARQWFSEFQPGSDHEVIEALRFEFGISQRQAYTDVHNCKRLFASIEKVNEEFEQIMFIEGLKRLRRKSIELETAKGFDVAARCDATMLKVKGYDKDITTLPEPKIVNVLVTADISVIGLKPVENVDALLKSFKRKKEEQRLAEAEEIEFDELIDNPRNESQHQRN